MSVTRRKDNRISGFAKTGTLLCFIYIIFYISYIYFELERVRERELCVLSED